MFFKIGNLYIPVNEIEYIKKFPCGANVYLKSGETLKLTDLSDEEWAYIDNYIVKPFSKNPLSDPYEEGGL